MKNRKGLIGLVIIVAVLVLGIGYAAVTAVNLQITGTAAAKSNELKVGFDGVVSTDLTHATGATATGTNSGTLTTGVTSATITVSDLAKVGDYVVVTYEIKNYETDLDASVYVSNIAPASNEYFTVTTDMTGSDHAKSIAAGGTTTVAVTVTLTKMPIEQADESASITIDLTATPVPKAGS